MAFLQVDPDRGFVPIDGVAPGPVGPGGCRAGDWQEAYPQCWGCSSHRQGLQRGDPDVLPYAVRVHGDALAGAGRDVQSRRCKDLYAELRWEAGRRATPLLIPNRKVCHLHSTPT